jgi:hypothetical protein
LLFDSGHVHLLIDLNTCVAGCGLRHPKKHHAFTFHQI